MNHWWIVFALLAAFFQAARIAVAKQLSFNFSAQALTFYVNFASLLVTFPLIYWHHDFPVTNSSYLRAILIGALLSGLGGWAFNQAIKISEISIVGPLMTLTPGAAVIIEWVLLSDNPSGTGFLGIVLLSVGSYFLGLNPAKTGWFGPLLLIFTHPGGRLSLIASLCFASASTFGREAIGLSDSLSFAVMVSIINPLVLFCMFTLQHRYFYREILGGLNRQYLLALLSLGLLFALMRIADQIALGMALASYVMAVKRMAGVFTVIIGHIMFREERLSLKLLGSVIMVSGVWVMIYD